MSERKYFVFVRLNCLPSSPCPYRAGCPLLKQNIGEIIIPGDMEALDLVEARHNASFQLFSNINLTPCTLSNNPRKGKEVDMELADFPVIYHEVATIDSQS